MGGKECYKFSRSESGVRESTKDVLRGIYKEIKYLLMRWHKRYNGLPDASGIDIGEAGEVGFGLPSMNGKRGAPGQVLKPTTAAKCKLKEIY